MPASAALEAGLLRGARASLDWSLIETSRRAGVSVASVLSAEGRGSRAGRASAASLAGLRQAYEQAGIVFLDRGAAGYGILISPARP